MKRVGQSDTKSYPLSSKEPPLGIVPTLRGCAALDKLAVIPLDTYSISYCTNKASSISVLFLVAIFRPYFSNNILLRLDIYGKLIAIVSYKSTIEGIGGVVTCHN